MTNLFEREKSNKINPMTKVIKDVENRDKKRRSAERFEDSYKRSTFFINNDLSERLDKLSKKHDRGYKTAVINALLENFLDAAEKE